MRVNVGLLFLSNEGTSISGIEEYQPWSIAYSNICFTQTDSLRS